MADTDTDSDTANDAPDDDAVAAEWAAMAEGDGGGDDKAGAGDDAVAAEWEAMAEGEGGGGGFGSVAGSPETIRRYMDEYVATGANYFVAAFQWGDLSHEQAMRSIELFTNEVMPHYVG